jgi:chitinase
MVSVANATGHKFFTLAFILGSSQGCVPAWGAQIPLNDSRILNDIHGIQNMGGDLKVSFGGAAAPYLEGSCSSVTALANAYKQVIDTTGIKHLDIDIEASFDIDQMNKALRQVQVDRPGTTVSFTLMVVGDTYGIIDSLGVDVLRNAKTNGVVVSTVNPMTMDYGASVSDWGDSVIMAATKTIDQMKTVWPEKTDAQIKAMLGVTPMIGRNDTGPVFTQAHATKLLNWARTNHIDSLAFWSVGRDNGGCPGGGVSPTCSSISQSTYEFTNIFKGFTG